MSRSALQRQQQKLQQQQQLLSQQQIMSENDAAAAAAEMFDLFCLATTMRQILGLHRNMCDIINLHPAPLNDFYPKLKAKIRSWKAQALWKKFDARAAHRAYAKGTACTGTRVLVIGAGPCGLRTAIEAQLLGAKVIVVEKRDRISRNNVLHLWPFVITDLRNLGAKKFYGKFCAGSIDHISIRQLQCILLKVALLLGVEIHEGVSFERIIEPEDGYGWRAAVTPDDHVVSHYEFDVLIGADGKRNTLEGFRRKEFRGKLAIAITANFINKKTEAEAKAEEISGVAFIFNQSFFKELYHTTGIDLENIVYYKDETHYFVMTAKKHSLIDKGVILQDYADPAELLAHTNVSREKLLDYAREAAEFSTKYQMPNLEFAVNHYGKPDVAMFDFTSMFAAETSCRVVVRKGFRLLQCLVGDSLLEPFWPTGSGCARGFLSSMDAAFAVKLWSNTRNSILGVLAQRESIYRLLNQTTPENLQRDIGSYTVDPATRYPNLNRTSVNVWQVKRLIDTDDDSILEQTFIDTNALQATQVDMPLRRKRRSGVLNSSPDSALNTGTLLLRWICSQLVSYDFVNSLKEASDIFTNGKVLCALISRFRSNLVDYNAVKDLNPIESNELAFQILEKELQIPRVMSAKESVQLNAIEPKVWLNYLSQICDLFRGEVPHVKHQKIDFSELREKYRFNSTRPQPDFSNLLHASSRKTKLGMQDMVDVPQNVPRRSVLDEDKLKRQRRHEQLMASGVGATTSNHGQQPQTETPRRAKKRRSAEKAANIEERQKRLQNIEENRQERLSKRRQQRYKQTQNFYKSLHMLQANTLLREGDENTPFEDYSIFLYRQQAPEFGDRVKELERKLLYPDRDRGDIPSALPRSNTDEQFSDRIKSMEQRISSRNTHGIEKKPKDLMRAIGKIESSDWNVREIERKIEQSKKTEVHGPKGREKVPKWSKEQFMARQNKMAKPTRQNSNEEKFKEIDKTLKNLDKQLKEGHNLDVGERGRNKVASIAGQFVKKDDTSDEKHQPAAVPKSSSKVALAFKKQAASEKCHFCKQTVYLMEKITPEGLVMHRSCLKCHHCHTNLRPGGYAFDREDPNGRFYCTQHFRLSAKPVRPAVRKAGHKQQTPAATTSSAEVGGASRTTAEDVTQTPVKLRAHIDNVAQIDLLDRGQTPERIEFENTDAMSDGEPSEEHIIDEHEWSGRNFLPESNNDSESELSSSDDSDSESDSDMFEEANDTPLGVQTLQLATDWIGKQNYTDSDVSDDFYDSSEGIADDGKDDTEGEEFKKARELRREEVRLLPLPPNLPTDTETESKITDNKENIAKNAPSSTLHKNQSLEGDKQSLKSYNSEKSFRSAETSISNGHAVPNTPITKTDMEKIEQTFDRKLSADIDAISEKLHRLNSMVKMNKDLETLAKENLVKSDILKKHTLKEKWLAENNALNANTINPKPTFEQKLENILRKPTEISENSTREQKQKLIDPAILADLVPRTPNFERKGTTNLSRSNSLRNSKNNLNINAGSITEKSLGSNLIRSDSLKSNTSSSSRTGEKIKPTSLSRNNSIKKSNEAIGNDTHMQIENILNIVRNMDISKSGREEPQQVSKKDRAPDMGKMLYDAEAKFSPKPNKRMSAKLKEIESQSFSGTMESIKSQMVMPTVSTQASSSVDLSKYFPNQKQDKCSAKSINKNQKNLKDIDLAKYFPSSPQPQRRAVETVADKLKKSQTEKAMKNVSPDSSTAEKAKPQRQASVDNATFSLREHQLDGAIDLTKKKKPTNTQVPKIVSIVKKGNVKIIKKIVPKGSKAKKAAEKIAPAKAVITQDESESIFDEILLSDEQALRSPSAEYQNLFNEEKSPSEDLSDKIERILEEAGIDLGLPRKQSKKLSKAKSFGEGELERPKVVQSNELKTKEDGDRPSGVQNILKRFESLSSVHSDENAFKLRRMESTTSNLNKSRGSITSCMSDSMNDLEKTMEYLKSEWQSEATNFLQKKRDKFYAQKRSAEEEKPTENVEEEQKKSKLDYSIPTAFKESKLAKFFGINQKSSEQNLKNKHRSIEQTKRDADTSASADKKVNNSLEELAQISVKKQQNKKNVTKKSYMEKFEEEKKQIKTLQAQQLKTPKKTDATSKLCPIAAENADQHSSQSTVNKAANSQESMVSTLPNFAVKNSSTMLQDSIMQNDPAKKEYSTFEKNSMVTDNPFKSQDVTIKESSTKLQDSRIKEGSTKLQESYVKEIVIESQDLTVKDSGVLNSPVKSDQLEIKNSPTISRQNATVAECGNPNTRPQVEDIKNLPKTGCDKSLSNSRRGSLVSLQSRRFSDSGLAEKLEAIAAEVAKANENIEKLDSKDDKEKAFENNTNLYITSNALQLGDDECDSLCTTISRSPSVAPVTVKMRGSSEDESIEKLFDQVSEELLAEVDFDSNDELVAITSQESLNTKRNVSKNIDDDKDYLGKLESLERDEIATNQSDKKANESFVETQIKEIMVEINENRKISTVQKLDIEVLDNNEHKELTAQDTKSNQRILKAQNHEDSEMNFLLNMSSKTPAIVSATEEKVHTQMGERDLNPKFLEYLGMSEKPFPVRPQRRQKSSSSSSEASIPIAPQRIKKKLAKLCPDDMPPSVQDLLKEAYPERDVPQDVEFEGVTYASQLKFPHIEVFDENEILMCNNPGTACGRPRNSITSLQEREPIVEIITDKSLPGLDVRRLSDTSSAEKEPKFCNSKIIGVNSNHNEMKNKPENNEKNKISNGDSISLSKDVSMEEHNMKFDRDRKLKNNVNSTSESSIMGENTLKRMGQELDVENEKYLNKSSLKVQATNSSQKSLDIKTNSSKGMKHSEEVESMHKLSGVVKSINLSRPLSKTSLSSSTKPTTPPSLQSKEQSLEWDMSKLPASPMPQRRILPIERSPFQERKLKDISPESKIKILNNLNAEEPQLKLRDMSPTQCIETLNNILNEKSTFNQESKEESMEWDMEKLPPSPMPRRKYNPSERPSMQSMQDIKLKELSPTSSIQLLNNLSRSDSFTSEMSQQRLIEEFEMERRQALSKRDSKYNEIVKPLEKADLVDRRILDLQEVKTLEVEPAPMSQKLIKEMHASRRGTPAVIVQSPNDCNGTQSTRESVIFTKESTPPNFKKLEIPTEIEPIPPESDLQSLCSFAVLELMENENPIIAPMPKVLVVPKNIPKYIPDPNEPIPEIFQNRPWPKPLTEVSEEEDIEVVETEKTLKTSSPVPEIFKDRQWPDGEKIFEKNDGIRANSVDLDDLEELLSKTHERRRFLKKPKSQSPQVEECEQKNGRTLDLKSSSKSVSDLRKNSPYTSIYASEHSLYKPQKLGNSNLELDRKSQISQSSDNTGPQRSLRAMKPAPTFPTDVIDSSTRMLLDRGKRLHNRKRDFVNERVVERNPYMRDVVEPGENLDTGVDDIESYRPKNYVTNTSTTPRFPSSRAYRRNSISKNYDYIDSTPAYSDYSSRSRRLHTPTLPAASISSLNSYHIPSSTPASVYGVGASSGRSSVLSDYFKRSPPTNYSERQRVIDSCVQSDSDSTSADEVELNSATEISTDSEFDNDEIIRGGSKLFIDNVPLRKPTKVQIKSGMAPTVGQKMQPASTQLKKAQSKGSYLQKYQQAPPQPQFKPLVQVDPALLNTNRAPLQNPRPGDYLLNKTASTEGIASKKSLELKKRYLLGEPANGNKIQKSGSTSVLDSRIRSFQSNISECQKLLNAGNGISPSMKTFLERTKMGESSTNDLMRSATTNILNDLRVEITIQKASSTASTDNEKENIFVNSKNELNKGMEYSEAVNTTLLESINKKSPTTPTNNKITIIETIDLVTPEKQIEIIDLTKDDTPTNVEPLNKKDFENIQSGQELTTDSNKITELTCDSAIRNEKSMLGDVNPDVSKDAKQTIPDILGHIDNEVKIDKQDEERQMLLSQSGDEEKRDSPEKVKEQDENITVQIQVPNIPWSMRKSEQTSSASDSSCSSNSSSLEDIQHFMLESTTSPDTQNSGGISGHQVPRVEIHDSSGIRMTVDNLMVIDAKYVGDPERLERVNIPEAPAVKTTVVEDDADVDTEPVTATPEPAECSVIEAESGAVPPPLPEHGPPLPTRGPPVIKAYNLKFDSKNENKIESLKTLPLIVDSEIEHTKVVKPVTLNLSIAQKSLPTTPTTPTAASRTPLSPLTDNDKTPTAELLSKCSDSETEATGTGQVLTETELSDWTADDCISENFVDMEFVANSNKGTIKRNKRGRKKHHSEKLASTCEVLSVVGKTAPVADFEGIFKTIDIDDIEFMDTGSEGSCAEPYSATNTALLRNRGYMEFIETPKHTPSHKAKALPAENTTITGSDKYVPIMTKHDEKLGIDYIEQGAYIMQDDDKTQDLKTPVNEIVYAPAALMERSVMTQSLTDSSTLNELDDDSLCVATKTTTEESDALTIVTSPLDSSSPKNQDKLTRGNLVEKNTEDGSTTSSFDNMEKASQPTRTTPSSSTTSLSKATPSRHTSHDISPTTPSSIAAIDASSLRKPSEELSYEEYVRALQQKITQISTARDSLDNRKQRRKSSKGEAPVGIFNNTILPNNAQTVINQSPPNLDLTSNDNLSVPLTSKPQTHKVPEIPTLTRKLEEITKERTKQKDLIHDLVMDKLQSKKQLNAEKRLHRSRQRTMLTSGYASGSSLSPTPKLAAATSVNDTNCTNQAHYHVSTAAVTANAKPHAQKTFTTVSPTFKENSLQKSPTYVSAYGANPTSPTRLNAYKQRPFSELMDQEQIDAFERYKINKTPSSHAISWSPQHKVAGEQQSSNEGNLIHAKSVFATPMAQARPTRDQTAITSPTANKELNTMSASTENLRSEARARARLKSNSELGLSPEEKMQLLRKRLHFDQLNARAGVNSENYSVSAVGCARTPDDVPTDLQLLERERKMSASKSVNDLVFLANHQKSTAADEIVITGENAPLADFTSDPNLLLSSTCAQTSDKPLKTKTNRRQKDPDRRKSLIQSLSSFFHKNSSSSSQSNKDKTAGTITGTCAVNSAESERPGTSGSNGAMVTATGGSDGVFSRFRISPKSKEKSKDKDDQHPLSTSSASMQKLSMKTKPVASALTSAMAQASASASAALPKSRARTPHERSNSQDCILSYHHQHNNKSHNYNMSRYNNNNNNKKSSPSSATAAFSSSSPQLYVHRPNYLTNTDDQIPPPIPPLPLHYQRSDDESYATETREHKKQRAISKATRQAELKRLRIAQEIQREQEEIEVELKELEARGVGIEKAIRGEGINQDNSEVTKNVGSNDEKLLKELLDIWRKITQLKKRDEELNIRQQELQLEHRHAQLKEELNLRLSCNKLDKSSADVAAEGAILNEMLDIVARRASLRPTPSEGCSGGEAVIATSSNNIITLNTRGQSLDNEESHI